MRTAAIVFPEFGGGFFCRAFGVVSYLYCLIIWVFDVPKVQGVRGHRCAGGAAVHGGYDFGHVFGGVLVASDVYKGAGDGAHHVAQKAVGAYFQKPGGRALPNHATYCDIANVGLGVCV